MNIITIAEIKRGGISAVEAALKKGPVHLIKHNQPTAVVLSEAEFARLSALADANRPEVVKTNALDWFMADQARGELSAAELARRLDEARGGWDKS